MAANRSNFSEVRRVFGLLDPRSKRRLIGIFAIMIVTGILETVNVGMFLPLMNVVLAPASGGGASAVRDALGWLGDRIGTSPLLAMILLFLAVFLLKNAVIAWAVYQQARFVAITRLRMRDLLVDAYLHKPYESHLQVNSAEAVYDILDSAPSVVGGLLQPALGIVMEITLAAGAAAALFIIYPEGAVVGTAFVALALAAYYQFTRRKVYRIGDELIRLSKESVRWAHFALGSTKENIVLGRGGYFTRRMRAISRKQIPLSAWHTVFSQMPRIYGEVVVFLAMGVVVYMVIAQKGSMTEALPILTVFAAAALRVFPSANRLLHYATSIRQTGPGLAMVYDDLRLASRMERAAEESKRAPAATAQAPFERDIAFSGVSYRYPGGRDWALKDIDLTIRKNEIVAFVGRTGSGKSTAADILLGLLPPTEGRLLLDGRPVAPGSDFWQGRIGYVPQSIYLIDDTLRRNVAFGIDDDRIDDERVRAVLRIARLDDTTGGLASGLDTVIGERGVRLSGGQRQRIGIARALYRDPEVLVLDEATSSLDSSTEREITEAIESLSGRKTLILIAHRLSTVQQCSRLFLLDGGQLAAHGAFAEVLAASADFRAMVEQARLRPAHTIDAVA